MKTLERPSLLRKTAYDRGPKRALDLTILLVAHLALLPLWLTLWIVLPILIVLDSGWPVFYRQKRVGRDGTVFDALKFRTMVVHADKIGPAWTDKNDPRITRVGRVLRKTALDELPQVLNILKGDMSFVGPRALALEEHALLVKSVPRFIERVSLRPGLTGLAQVYGNRDDAREKISYDLRYVESVSLFLDMKLLFLSVWVTARGRWESRQKKI